MKIRLLSPLYRNSPYLYTRRVTSLLIRLDIKKEEVLIYRYEYLSSYSVLVLTILVRIISIRSSSKLFRSSLSIKESIYISLDS